MKDLLGIAVVIPCYNLGRTVEDAIDSVLGQSRRASEIVVVDDGSTEVLTRQVLADLHRPATRVVTISHAGVAAARNHGVSLTCAPYLVFLDADDLMASRCLERMGEKLDSDPTLGFVSCALQAFEGADYVWKPPSADLVGSLTRGSVHISSLFRRALWEAVGGFDAELPAYEDLDFWLRALRSGFRGEILDEPLISYRVRPDSRYRKGIESQIYLQTMARILERHRPILDANGIDVLAEKESFLLELIDYRDMLLQRRDSLRQQLMRLDNDMTAARRTLSERSATGCEPPGVAEVACPAPWRDSGLKQTIEQFLAESRWLIRGDIAVVVDEPWAAEGLTVPRWDETPSMVPPQHLLLDSSGALEAASKDAVVLVLLSPTAPVESAIERVSQAVKPRGSLLVITSAFRREQVAEEQPGCDPVSGWMRSALSRVLPIGAFDVGTKGDLVTAVVRIGPGARPRRWRPRIGARRSPPRPGVILAYHRVASLRPDTHRLCVSADHFRRQMRMLRQQYTVMPLIDLFLASREGELPAHAVAVTLDDGYVDALTTAAPILEEEGVPATFFVNTERWLEPHEAWHDQIERILLSDAPIPPKLELSFPTGRLQGSVGTRAERRSAQMRLHGAFLTARPGQREEMLEALVGWSGHQPAVRPERRLLLRDEVLELARIPGCDIGSHSAHHLQLPLHPSDVQLAELHHAKESLEELLDMAVVSFAYPFGSHDAALEDLVRRTPHLFAVTTQPGLVTSSTDPMRLPRLEAPDADEWVLNAALEALFAEGSRAGSIVVGPRSDVTSSIGGQAGRASASDLASATNRRRARAEYESGEVYLSSRPDFLIIDPTSRCNARCVMCPVSFRAPGDHGVDLDRSVFEKLLPVISTASQINLFSSGEPTIARDMVSVVEETRRIANGDAVIWLSTNGKRLPLPILESVMAPRMGLQFSVDGGTKDVFESIRRGITFEELCHSLELAQRRKGSQRFPSLSFSSTISKRNIHELGNIFLLAARYGIEHVYFYEADPEVTEEEQYTLDYTDRAAFEAQLPQIDATGVRYSNGLHFRGSHGLRAVEPPPPSNPPAIHCLAPWSVFHQRADGTVRPCCTLRKSMGNLRHTSFEDVWNGEGYVKLRRAFVEQSGIPGTCYRCTDPLRTRGSEQPAQA